MGIRVSILLTLVLVSSIASAQTSRSGPEAATSPPPKSGASISDQISWIATNPGHVAAAGIFSDVMNEVATLRDLERIRLEVIPILSDSTLRQEATAQLGAIYRTARRYEIAVDLYRQAYELSLSSDLQSLFAHAQLLFELGDNAVADAESREIVYRTTDFSLKRRAYTLSARIAFETGNTERALEMLETLASLVTTEGASRELAEVETLVLLQRIYELADEPAEAARIDALLLRLFPDSVAAKISGNQSRLLTLPGLPSALLLSDTASEAFVPGEGSEGIDSAGAPRDQPRLSAIQVGSFSDAENAEHLTSDLRMLGLLASVEEVPREGATLHQVIVAIPGGTTESAARVLSTLREHGFDGFLVY